MKYEGGPLSRAADQPLAGFTLDETPSYIRACLRGTGCDWAEELVQDEKEAGTHLNLRYDASAWAQPVEELSPEAVRLSDPSRLRLEAARLIVSSGRTIVAEVTLNRPPMVVGRDDSCDISLDSRYVSRFQNLFLETQEGWMLIDLSSTNGCFVNGRRVREHRLRDGDLIAVGHHQMRFTGPSARTRPGMPHSTERDTTLVAMRQDAQGRTTSH